MREKKMETVMGIMLLAAALLLATGGVRQAASQRAQDADQTIVVDAGHGGDDPGKVGINGERERDVNLAIAKKLQKLLEDKGFTVVMTREDENGLYAADAANKKQDDMRKRCDMIDGANAALAVSIHQNSYPQESVKGPQVFYYKNSAQAQELAGYIQESLNTGLSVERPREMKANDTYYLLKRTKAPTVIVECGFLSNHEEAGKLVTEEYQQKVAEAVCEGIQGYLKGGAAGM
ncbi:N-acetylmuramoyl-L-alanine amidase [Lachnospiraceae bacterium 46-15]